MPAVDRARLEDALPSYAVRDEIGIGGAGVVFAATHRQLGRDVAVKALIPALAGDPDSKRRFREEARLLASFNHTHIVPIYDFVEKDDLCLLVMERLTGGTLADRRPSGPGSDRVGCALALAICSALHYAHRNGVLHRDIKPENVLFAADDTIKVADFGIAKVLAGDTTATKGGFMLGTPAYMAPEQVRSQQVTPATDVYAAGVLLYWVLSGRYPFPAGEDPLEVLYKRLHSDPVPLRSVNPEVHASLAACVMRALERDPADRYASAEAFGVAIADASGDAWGPDWLASTGVAVVPATGIAQAVHSGRAVAIEPTIGPDDRITLSRPVPPPRTDSAAAAPVEDPGPRPAPDSPAPGRRHGRLRIALAGAVALIALVAVVSVVLLTGGEEGESPKPGSAATGPSLKPDSAWRPLPAAPTARQQLASAVAGGQIWLAGGLRSTPEGPRATRTVEAFDPAVKSWRAGPPLPLPLHHEAGAAYRGQFVVIGGWLPRGDDLSAETVRRAYALRGERWTELPAMRQPRAAGAAATASGRLVVVGGQADGRLVRGIEVFDGRRWSEGAPIPTPREHLAAVSDGRYVYAVGGRELSSSENLAALERYDPVADRWERLPSMPEPRAGFGATVVGGNLVASGGETPTGALRTVVSYNFRSRRWSSLAPMPLTVHGHAVAGLGRSVYVIGGGRKAGHFASTNEAEVLELRAARSGG